MLAIEKLVCGYRAPDTEVVGATSLELPAGSFVCVIGRNGAGKSTLMRTIAGLQPALSGHVELEGVRVDGMSAPDRARAVSVVTTERVSSPGLLAQDVVELGRHPYTDWQGRLTAADKEIVSGAIAQMGATHLAPKLFNSLSDGERQRIMIARALAQTSKIMILDEITAFLDLPGRVEVMALLRRHAQEQKKIVLLSSHDLELSLELSGELWIVDGGRLTVGSADDLIAAGSLAQAFDSGDVVFDGARRRFVLRQSA